MAHYLHPRRLEIIEWLSTLREDVPLEQQKREYEHSYQTWARNGRAWDRCLATGGVYTMRAIRWYQHVHRPGSTDSRPGIILDAICRHLDSAKP